MSNVNIKNKLKSIIKDMLLSDSDIEVPDVIQNQILQNYDSTPIENSSQDDLDSFVKNLQIWIEKTQITEPNSTTDKEQQKFDLLEKYLQAENKYCEITSKLAVALNDVVKHKETYSEYFKDECKAQDIEIEILRKKCETLKQQFFVKLYGEENAVQGHLVLREKLKDELANLKKEHMELLEYNKKMSEIQNDKTFCELFRVYKELKKIEQMTEIIGSL